MSFLPVLTNNSYVNGPMQLKKDAALHCYCRDVGWGGRGTENTAVGEHEAECSPSTLDR